jgi:NADH:ubiquinone oxidoreductase subunit 3 (subunit A)
MVSEFFPVYVYFGLVALVTAITLGVSGLFPQAKTANRVKYMSYESGNITDTHLLRKRFPLRHYLVALMFLVFDIEVIFMFPWAVIGKQIGAFAFYEMAFFMIALLVGLAYVWRKGGLEWQ